MKATNLSDIVLRTYNAQDINPFIESDNEDT